MAPTSLEAPLLWNHCLLSCLGPDCDHSSTLRDYSRSMSAGGQSGPPLTLLAKDAQSLRNLNRRRLPVS